LAGDCADLPRNPGPARVSRRHPTLPAPRRRATRSLYRVRLLHPGGHLRHALERGHRRPALLQELSRLYQLQTRLCYPRRTAACHRVVAAALRHLHRPCEAIAAMDNTDFERELRDLAHRIARIEQHLSLTGPVPQPHMAAPEPEVPSLSD